MLADITLSKGLPPLCLDNSRHLALAKELTENKVVVTKWNEDYCGLAKGRAVQRGGFVYTPIPNDDLSLAIGFHEIGHIVLDHCFSDKWTYQTEYEASVYSVEKMQEYGYPFEEAEKWMGLYVLAILAETHRAWDYKIPEKPNSIVLEWLGVDYSEWADRYVEVDREKERCYVGKKIGPFFFCKRIETRYTRGRYGTRQYLEHIMGVIKRTLFRGVVGMAKEISSVSSSS